MKRFYESKAIWLGILMIASSVATFLQGEEWIKNYPEVAAALGSVAGILVIIVRYLTDKPMELANKWRRKN